MFNFVHDNLAWLVIAAAIIICVIILLWPYSGRAFFFSFLALCGLILIGVSVWRYPPPLDWTNISLIFVATCIFIWVLYIYIKEKRLPTLPAPDHQQFDTQLPTPPPPTVPLPPAMGVVPLVPTLDYPPPRPQKTTVLIKPFFLHISLDTYVPGLIIVQPHYDKDQFADLLINSKRFNAERIARLRIQYEESPDIAGCFFYTQIDDPWLLLAINTDPAHLSSTVVHESVHLAEHLAPGNEETRARVAQRVYKLFRDDFERRYNS